MSTRGRNGGVFVLLTRQGLQKIPITMMKKWRRERIDEILIMRNEMKKKGKPNPD